MELRIAGILLLLSGSILMLAAIVLLDALPTRTTFSLAGLAVELLGFILLSRSHLPKRKNRDA